MMISRIATVGTLLGTMAIASRTYTAEQFGIWSIIYTLTCFTPVLDLGYRFSLGNRLASLRTTSDPDEGRHTFLSVFHLQILLAILASLFCLLLLPHWNWGGVFKIKDHAFSDDLQHLLPVSCALLMIALPWNLAGSAFFAYLKIELISVFTLIQSALLLVGFGIAAKYLTFDAAVLSYIEVSILTNLLLTIFLFLKMNWRWDWSPVAKQWEILRSMGKPSFDFFLLSISAMTANTIGPVLSGMTQGAHAAGDFTLIQKMFSFLTTVHLAILSPIGPAYTMHAKQGDWHWVREKMHFCIRIIWPILFIGCGSLIYCAHPLILRLWSGKWITSYSLTLLIAATAILAGFGNTYSVLLNSLGAVRLQAALSILMILPVITLPIYLGGLYGVWGVALSSFLCVIPGCFLCCFYAQYALKQQYINV